MRRVQPSKAPRILKVEEMLGVQRTSQRGLAALPGTEECRDGGAAELGLNGVQLTRTRQVDHERTLALKT